MNVAVDALTARATARALSRARQALVQQHPQAIYLAHAEAERASMPEPVIVLAVRDNEVGGKICAAHGCEPAVFAVSAPMLLLRMVGSSAEYFSRFSAALAAHADVPEGEVRIAVFSDGGVEVCRWRLDVRLGSKPVEVLS